MNILVRMPNWLGDMVMASGFLQALKQCYPDASVSLIVKKGLEGIVPLFGNYEHSFVFDKQQYKGMRGAWRFGHEIQKVKEFDLFFCLPDSLSAAAMAYASGARRRIGFKKEWRNLFLTHPFKKPKGVHRVETYVALLSLYTGKELETEVSLKAGQPTQDYIVVNINSEASSRRLTLEKAVELINELRRKVYEKIILIGAPKEQPFVQAVYGELAMQEDIENRAGATSLPQLAALLAGARLMLTTDSGPAHLANALGTHTVALFGAGNEKYTSPYNRERRSIIRLNELACEPCEKNVCVLYGVPLCLERLDTDRIIATVQKHLSETYG